MTTDQPLTLVSVRAGTAPRMTPDGVEEWFVVELRGEKALGPPVVQRFAVNPANLAEFLHVINGAAREHFPT